LKNNEKPLKRTNFLKDKGKKPFQVGDLIMLKHYPQEGVFIVLECYWENECFKTDSQWEMRLFSQQKGPVLWPMNPGAYCHAEKRKF